MFKFKTCELEELFKIFKNKQKICIEGVNGLGEKFVCEGYVAQNDMKHPALFEEKFYLDFGEKNKDEIRSEFFTAFYLNIKEEPINVVEQLIVNKIQDGDQHVVYENKKFNKILKVCEENKKSYATMDKLGKLRMLKDYIAKPMIIEDCKDSYQGIFCGIISLNNGVKKFCLLDGVLPIRHKINDNMNFYDMSNGEKKRVFGEEKDDEIQYYELL